MKKIFLSFAAIALVVTGCDLFGDLDDVDFSTDFTASYNVDITDNQASLVKTINLKDDPDIEKYQNKLKDVTVDSVILTVKNYAGAAGNKLNGTISYSEVTSDTPITFAQITNLALENGKKTKITAAQAAITAAQTIMKDKKEIKVYLNGTATSTATFTLEVQFYVTCTAEALD